MSELAKRIAQLNDAFRQTLGSAYSEAGKVVFTHGINSLPHADQVAILKQVRAYTAFDKGNNPYDKNDFGTLTHKGEKVFWKIDYYDTAYEYGSDKPEDATVTRRVLTIMFAHEY